MTPRRWFHVLLGAVFVPVVSLPLLWGVALSVRRRGAADPEARRWSRWLLGLAAADTLVSAVLVALVAFGGPAEMRTVGGPIVELREPAEQAETVPRSADPVVIGVAPDGSAAESGARVGDVLPGGPADAAGVRPGDLIVALAGEEIPGFAALRRAVAERAPGVAVPLVVVREGATRSLTVTPRRASELPGRGPAPAGTPVHARSCMPRLTAPRALPIAALGAALAVLGAVVARRVSRRSARGVWWAGLALAAAGLLPLGLESGACLVLGGPTPATLLALIAGPSVVLGVTALPGLRRVDRTEASPPARTWRSAVALGGWYLATGWARLAVLLAPALQVAEERGWSLPPLGEPVLRASGLRGPLLIALAITVVLLAPIAEEIAFRGLLQPALGAWLGPAGAVAATAALFAAAHWSYGPKLPVIVLVAGVLGWARAVSGGLRAPIALHALVNAVNLAVLVW